MCVLDCISGLATGDSVVSTICYSSSCRWTFGLFSGFGCYAQNCYNHSWTSLFCGRVCFSPGLMPGSGVTWLGVVSSFTRPPPSSESLGCPWSCPPWYHQRVKLQPAPGCAAVPCGDADPRVPGPRACSTHSCHRWLVVHCFVRGVVEIV